MANRIISLLVKCWYDRPTDTAQLQLIRTDSSEAVRLGNGHFHLQVSVDEQTHVMRCLFRHVATGREAYVQGGPNLHAFIKTCLLNPDEVDYNDSGTTEG